MNQVISYPNTFNLPGRLKSLQFVCVLISLMSSISLSFGQSCPGITVAGGNGDGYDANQLSYPFHVTVDVSGYIYVADYNNSRIQKFAPGSTSASSGTTVAGGNGNGSDANQLDNPYGVAIDRAGYIYVADSFNHRIQKFAPGSTSASNGTTVAGGNGIGSDANQLNYPYRVAIDKDGYIYVADTSNERIQKFAPGSTSASNGTTVAGGNGNGSDANQLAFPTDVVVDGSGNIYVADNANYRIQKFAPGSTSASSGITVAGGNDEGSDANQFGSTIAVSVDVNGFIYVADAENHRVQKFAPNSTSASNGITIAGGNGEGSDANQLAYPYGLFADASAIYVADTYNHRIQRFAPLSTAFVHQLTADETACPVRLQGKATGTDFIFTGPQGYVFSEVHRQAGDYQPVALQVTVPGTYQLNAVTNGECGSSEAVKLSVTVSKACP